jgi:hypothetical protein
MLLHTEESRMQFIEAFLASRGLSLETIVRATQSRWQCDAIMLVGSVAEGVANNASDIDVAVFHSQAWSAGGDIRIADHAFAQEALIPSDSTKLRWERYSPAVMELAAGIIRPMVVEHFQDANVDRQGRVQTPTGYRYPHVYGLLDTVDWITVLHRVKAGVVLYDPCGRISECRQRLCLDHLAGYIGLVFFHNFWIRAADYFGQEGRRQPESGLSMLRAALTNLSTALIASYGDTLGVSEKWNFQLLKQLTGESSQRAVDLIFELYFRVPPEGVYSNDSKAMVHEVTYLVRDRLREAFPYPFFKTFFAADALFFPPLDKRQ